jgi:signal transduction histidine kinase
MSEEITTFGRLLTPAERDSMRVKFSNVSFSGIADWNPIPQGLVLPHEHNNISFNFNAIETGRNHLVKYQYMMEGYDHHWSPATTVATASYGNMYEGKYTFMLKAQSPEGVWSEPLTYTFHVRPPWWRTWWAYAGYAILFLWGLRMFSMYRERHLRFEKEKLELKVKHRTQMLEDAIDTLKNTQAQLIQSEKMASLGELTSGIAHEIQNPLNFVNNFSQLNRELIDDLHDEINKGNIGEVREISNDLKENMERIFQHGKRADAIVKGMLQHTRVSTGQKEPVEINSLANEYLKIAFHVIQGKEKDLHIELETQFDTSIGNISVIPQDIGRVLLNLYNNAFYAVAEKRKKLGSAYLPVVSVTTNNKGANVEILVRDNGLGIPVAIKDKIFQPFFTTKPPGEGTGLGLSLSYDVIKAHQGTLQVESRAGEYTEFIISLPA